MSTLYDGDFDVAEQQGPAIRLNDGVGDYWRYTYTQRASAYTPTPAGVAPDAAFNNRYLLGDGAETRSVGADIVEFDRFYADIPATRNTYESFLPPARYFSMLDTGEIVLAALFTITIGGAGNTQHSVMVAKSAQRKLPKMVSRLQHDYFAGDPRGINILPMPPLAALASETEVQSIFEDIVVEESIIRPWRGIIYERTTRYCYLRQVTGDSGGWVAAGG